MPKQPERPATKIAPTTPKNDNERNEKNKEAEVRTPFNTDAPTMKLEDLFEQYAARRLRGKSENTIRLYGHTIRAFGRFLKREPTVSDLTTEAIEDHMWAIIKRGGSPASANKDRSQLICLWKFAAEKRIVDTFPDVQAMKEPDRVPMGWLPEELAALLKAAGSECEPVGSIPGRIYWVAVLRIVLDTGERIGAVRALDRHALQGRYLLVPASARKGKTRDRLYALQDETVEAIKRLLERHDDAELFPWPFGENYIYRRFDAILRRAGLPTDRRSKFHRIRRTVASAVARAGGDPTAALDHASPKTTKKYLDPRIVGGVEVSEILAQYLAKPDLRRKPDPIPNAS